MTTTQSGVGGPIRLIMAADSDYVIPLAVSVRSVVEMTQKPVELLILDGGLTAKDRQQLLDSWPTARLAVRWLEVEARQLGGLPLWGRMKPATYYRLLLSSLAPPGWTKALWLDSDILVLEDLSTLWDLETSGWPLLAVRDLVVPSLGSLYGVSAWRELGLDPALPHFNAGVMLLDLGRWRVDRIGERAVGYLRQHGDRVCFFDQEALNAVLAGCWGELDPRWNQIASMAGQPFLDASHLDPEVYRQVVANPFLMHYSGSLKPWKCHGLAGYCKPWYKVLDRTAWAGWRPPITLRSIALGLYSTKLRRWLYPLETWYITLLRGGAV
jgi:lipopolysaccharide biosynthesis glycosyltransferase